MKKSPPLALWIITISIFIVVQAIIFFIPSNKLDYGISYPRIDDSILKNNQVTPIHKIMAIGSSITDEAIEKEEDIITLSQENGGEGLMIKKVTGVTDKLSLMINRFDLVNYLINEKPEAVCIQTELAAIQLSPEHIFAPEQIVQITQDNKLFFKKLLNGFKDPPTDRLYWLNDELVIVKDTILFQGINRSIKSRKEAQNVFDFIQTLNKKGIKVYFLDIPRAHQFEDKYFTTNYKDSLNHLFELYKNETGSKRIQYTGPVMHFINYRDIGGHMNITGRKLYTRWLVNTIQNELKK